MNKLLKRLSVLLLCVALIMGDSSMGVFAAEMQEKTEAISEIIEDDSEAVEEASENEKEPTKETDAGKEEPVEETDAGKEEPAEETDAGKEETAKEMDAVDETSLEDMSEEIVAIEEVADEALNDITYSLKHSINDDGKTVTITGIEGEYTGELIIPDTIDGYPVTCIGKKAFYNCYGFTGNLTIPDSVTCIGDSAFEDCYGFTGDLTIPGSVTSIGKEAFYNCYGFTGNLTIPDGITSIGDSAFEDCYGFTGDLTIPDSVTSIGNSAFYQCSGFTGDLTIPDSVTSIGNSAFYQCSGFTGSLTIPGSVTSIGKEAFYNCSGFTGDLTIPGSVTSIGKEAFYNCYGFTGELTIPDSITSIGDGAFKSCSGFTGSLTIPGSVTSIGNSAFYQCSGFTGSLTIPGSVTSIGNSAFYQCSGFTGNLIIPDSVTSIGNYAFYNCYRFTGSLTIPDSVASIGDYAFGACFGFTGNLTIPNGVTSIGDYAFGDCNKFTGDLVIPDGVTSIGNSAFDNCRGFTGELKIPDSVTSIGSYAFSDCSGFTGELKIPDSVTYIYSGAFSGCSGFTGDLVIPDSVTSIGSCAFSGCSGFTGALKIPDGVTCIDYKTFNNCSGFTGKLVIPDSVTKIWDSAFSGCSGFTGDLVIPDSVTRIGNSAFAGCSGFDGCLIISGSVVIPENAFDGCNFIDTIVGFFWIRPIANQTYTGKAISPNVEVYHGGERLVLNKDYSLRITKNINIGEALVTVTGKGNYSGVETAGFTIVAADISSDSFTADDFVLKSNGRDQKPKPVLKWNGRVVAANTYTYKYFAAQVQADGSWGATGDELTAVKEAGKYVIVLTAKDGGNFIGTRTVKVTLTGSAQTLVSSLAITAIKPQTYTGSAIEPAVTVKSGRTELVRSEDGVAGDYTVEYKNNTAVGTATVTIKGLGDYVGTKTTTFKITGTPVTKATVEGITATMPYTGNAIRFNNLKLYIKATRTTEKIDLRKGTDYTIAYANNLYAGTATVTFTGINGYTGVIKKTFRITPYKYADDNNRISIDFADSDVATDGIEYSKGGVKPAVTVKYTNADKTKRILNEKTDYTVTYLKNTAVNDCSNDKNLPTVKITLKGSYSGILQKNFKINAKALSEVKAEAADKTYVNKAGAYKSAVKLTDTDGKALAANRDYDAAVEYSVARDGQKKVLGAKDSVYAGETVTVTVKAKAAGNYTGTTSTTYNITQAAISSAKVAKIESQIYTGKSITLKAEDITIKPTALGDALVYGTDYEIVEGSYVNNINKGTASVVIRGIGNYGGTRKITFKIESKGLIWWWRQ